MKRVEWLCRCLWERIPRCWFSHSAAFWRQVGWILRLHDVLRGTLYQMGVFRTNSLQRLPLLIQGRMQSSRLWSSRRRSDTFQHLLHSLLRHNHNDDYSSHYNSSSFFHYWSCRVFRAAFHYHTECSRTNRRTNHFRRFLPRLGVMSRALYPILHLWSCPMLWTCLWTAVRQLYCNTVSCSILYDWPREQLHCIYQVRVIRVFCAISNSSRPLDKSWAAQLTLNLRLSVLRLCI